MEMELSGFTLLTGLVALVTVFVATAAVMRARTVRDALEDCRIELAEQQASVDKALANLVGDLLC